MYLVSRTDQQKPVPEGVQMNGSQAELVCLKAWVLPLRLETGGHLGLLCVREGLGCVCLSVCTCVHMFFAGAGGGPFRGD